MLLSEFSNEARVHDMVSAALAEFDTILVAEKYDRALAALMHHLKWPLGDMLSVSMNARPSTAPAFERQDIFAQSSGEMKASFAAE